MLVLTPSSNCRCTSASLEERSTGMRSWDFLRLMSPGSDGHVSDAKSYSWQLERFRERGREPDFGKNHSCSLTASSRPRDWETDRCQWPGYQSTCQGTSLRVCSPQLHLILRPALATSLNRGIELELCDPPSSKFLKVSVFSHDCFTSSDFTTSGETWYSRWPLTATAAIGRCPTLT